MVPKTYPPSNVYAPPSYVIPVIATTEPDLNLMSYDPLSFVTYVPAFPSTVYATFAPLMPVPFLFLTVPVTLRRSASDSNENSSEAITALPTLTSTL